MTPRRARTLALVAAGLFVVAAGCGGGGPFQGDPDFAVLGAETTEDGKLSTYRVKVTWEGSKSTPNYAVYLVAEPAKFDPEKQHAREWVWRARGIEPLLTVWQAPETLLVQVADDTLTEQNSYTVRKQARRGVFVITDRIAPAAEAPPPGEDADTGWGAPPAAEEPPPSLFADSVATGAPR
jgi:hypothetical protein